MADTKSKSMKPDSNIETDRLLHRFARRRRDGSLSGAERGGADPENTPQERHGESGHLDADELIAYAENALPIATRTRYTGHLSECDSCRKQVTDLVISSGVAVQLEAQATKQTKGHARSWRDSMAAMFAPRVLRYAASVILLAGITTIAIVVWRGGRDARFQTSQSQSENRSLNGNPTGSPPLNNRLEREKQSNAQTPEREGEEGSKQGSVPGEPSKTLKDESENGPVETPKTGQDQGEAKPAAPASVPTGTLSGGQSAPRDEEASANERRQPSLRADAVDKSKASKEVDRGESTGRAARESASRAETDESVSTEGATIAESKAPATATETSVAKKSARRNTESSPAAPSQETASDDRKREAVGAGNAAESRNVSGRQFVRRDGAWVDAAYRSQATTNVKRGSEQYRALVADEPGLRAVANQLGGEVIVVWKGRAYRIN